MSPDMNAELFALLDDVAREPDPVMRDAPVDRGPAHAQLLGGLCGCRARVGQAPHDRVALERLDPGQLVAGPVKISGERSRTVTNVLRVDGRPRRPRAAARRCPASGRSAGRARPPGGTGSRARAVRRARWRASGSDVGEAVPQRRDLDDRVHDAPPAGRDAAASAAVRASGGGRRPREASSRPASSAAAHTGSRSTRPEDDPVPRLGQLGRPQRQPGVDVGGLRRPGDQDPPARAGAGAPRRAARAPVPGSPTTARRRARRQAATASSNAARQSATARDGVFSTASPVSGTRDHAAAPAGRGARRSGRGRASPPRCRGQRSRPAPAGVRGTAATTS